MSACNLGMKKEELNSTQPFLALVITTTRESYRQALISLIASSSIWASAVLNLSLSASYCVSSTGFKYVVGKSVSSQSKMTRFWLDLGCFVGANHIPSFVRRLKYFSLILLSSSLYGLSMTVTSLGLLSALLTRATAYYSVFFSSSSSTSTVAISSIKLAEIWMFCLWYS